MRNFIVTIDENDLNIFQDDSTKLIFSISCNSSRATFGKNQNTGEWKFSEYQIGFPEINIDLLSSAIENEISNEG